MHKLEVQAIADGEVAIGIVGLDPVYNGQLSLEELKRCENDPRARLKMTKNDLPQPVARTKGARYTPVSKRGEKPDAIAYLIKNFPELLDAQVARLLGTTKETIAKVRDRSHWNATNIKPHSPVLLGLCKQSDLEAAVKRAQRRVPANKPRAARAAKRAKPYCTKTPPTDLSARQAINKTTNPTSITTQWFADWDKIFALEKSRWRNPPA